MSTKNLAECHLTRFSLYIINSALTTERDKTIFTKWLCNSLNYVNKKIHREKPKCKDTFRRGFSALQYFM